MDVNKLTDEEIRSLIVSDLSEDDIQDLTTESLKCASYEQAIKLMLNSISLI